MTTTPNPCRNCRVSRTACDNWRELRDHPCCDDCAHPDDDTPPTSFGAVSEDS